MRLRRKAWIEEAILQYRDILFLEVPEGIAGHWRDLFPHPERPLYVELGTGKGQFISRMAAMRPDANFVGIEREQGVMYYAAKKTVESETPLENVRLLLVDAKDLETIFAPGEIDGLFLNFSDPWPKARHYKRRLTYRENLDHYASLLAKGGRLVFKTDNRGLFAFTVEELAARRWKMSSLTLDLHAHPAGGDAMTEYEEKFSRKGNTICRLVAQKPEP